MCEPLCGPQMGAGHIWKRRSAEREYAREEAGKVLEDVCRSKISTFVYVGIGDVQEITCRRYICEVIEDSIGRAKIYGFQESRSKNFGESRNHTQVTSFGVCAAREEPLLEHILICAIRIRAYGDLRCECHQCAC
jgi:hypothetical protein